MRVDRCARDDEHLAKLRQHAAWLLSLGDGKLSSSDGEIIIPAELCMPTPYNLIDFVYHELAVKHQDIAWVSARSILCPRNEVVDRINDQVTDQFPGDTVTCLSVDTVAEADQQAIYPQEYLNSLNLSGLPPHKLSIKVGIPVMLLRNIDPQRGHCNGTRYIVRHIGRRYIEAEVVCGREHSADTTN